MRTATPRAAASRIASPTTAAVSGPRLKSYWARSSVCWAAPRTGRDLVRDLERLLAAVCQGAERDRGCCGGAGHGGDRGDVQLLPRRAGGDLRRRRLREYLGSREEAPVLLVGEAPGYRGARVSGHSVHLGAAADRGGAGRGDRHDRPPRSRRAWRGGARPPLERRTDASGNACTNRRPSRREVEDGLPFARRLAAGRRVVAVGRLAESALGAPYVRHPSTAGLSRFANS